MVRAVVLIAVCIALHAVCVAAGRNFYEILDVKRDAKPEAIKRAYRRLSLKWHPGMARDSAAAARMCACTYRQALRG